MRIAYPRLLLAPLAVLLAVAFSSGPAHAQSCPATAAGAKYKVKIDSAPTGATLYIGSKSCPAVGNTPWSGSLGKGDITVIIEAQGYEPAQRVFTVRALRTVQELFVPLTRRPQIEIRADADPNLIGAAVSVDGQPSGVVQGSLVIPTTAGRHQIEITKQGFQPLTQWVDLTTTPVLVLTPVLVVPKKYGTILVDADVPDAEVYIDGSKHPDNTPAVIQNVLEGAHKIEVKKPPAPPWTGMVNVEANKQVRVKADMGPQVGTVRVLSETPGARAYLDGIEMGAVNVDIKDVRAGDHTIEVKAPGFQTAERKVTVRAGQLEVVKMELVVSMDLGTLKIVSTVPEAEVFIDGAAVGKVPQERRIAVGPHPVMVRLNGYKSFEQTVHVDAGKTITVSAELKAVGRLRILSTPAGATVTINGIPVGKTPFDSEVEVGDSVVRLEYPGFQAFEQTMSIQGGKTQTVSRELAIAGRSESELQAEQKGLSSFGARTLPRGRSTVDFDAGYPYFANGRITVGAGRIQKKFGFDATVGVRTMLARSEIGLGARMMVADDNPFSAAVFVNGWWGSRLLDDSQRNGVTFEGGALASLTALTNVTITGRAYLQLWSDRHCPEVSGGRFQATEPTAICEDYLANTITAEDKQRAEKLTGTSGNGFFDRENGARFLLSIIAEITVDQHWNVYGILEGAPFQDERALFTQLFSDSMFETDYVLYGRLGLSYKF